MWSCRNYRPPKQLKNSTARTIFHTKGKSIACITLCDICHCLQGSIWASSQKLSELVLAFVLNNLKYSYLKIKPPVFGLQILPLKYEPPVVCCLPESKDLLQTIALRAVNCPINLTGVLKLKSNNANLNISIVKFLHCLSKYTKKKRFRYIMKICKIQCNISFGCYMQLELEL